MHKSALLVRERVPLDELDQLLERAKVMLAEHQKQARACSHVELRSDDAPPCHASAMGGP